MTTCKLTPVTIARTEGDNREWALCNYFHIERSKHDASRYDQASDISVNNMHISVKADGFTLMSGRLCEGLTDFGDIWELYKSRTHSNTFAYVTRDYIAYIMNLAEFEEFIFAFCSTCRESSKNGGGTKIKCRHESKKMVEWLASRVEA